MIKFTLYTIGVGVLLGFLYVQTLLIPYIDLVANSIAGMLGG